MDFLEFLFDVVRPWIAATIVAAIGLVLGIVGVAWHANEASNVALCNTSAGRFGQAFNAAASADCGSSSLLAKVAVAVAIVGFGVLGLALVGLAALGATGKLQDLND